MIDRSLCLMTLHVMWKAWGLARSTGSEEDKMTTQESLREQRDTLLEKLLEYAVGTQSNTLNSVRRSVSFSFEPVKSVYLAKSLILGFPESAYIIHTFLCGSQFRRGWISSGSAIIDNDR